MILVASEIAETVSCTLSCTPHRKTSSTLDPFKVQDGSMRSVVRQSFAFRGLLSVILLVATFGCMCVASAKPIVYQAVGTREAIQPTIDRFKNDIVYGIGADAEHPPAKLGSFKIATFEDLPPRESTLRTSGLTSGGL
jgi:hypothetical protein